VRPTWSVNTLLSSYPTPTISSATLLRLHELSALIPPPAGTPEHDILKREMEDLVRLVEAVKLVDTKDVHLNGPRDEQNGDQQYNNQQLHECQEQDHSGRSLLSHASRTLDGFYVVDADRKR
jgi:Asp-tRNA(Asn)/Glu-tRNA(Gln) amidotransferase C subunit